MRKFVAFCCCLAAFGCSPRVERAPGFRMVGEIEGAGQGEVSLEVAGAYLGYTYSELTTVPMTGGRFEIAGRLDYPQMVWVRVGREGPRIPVFLGDDQVTLEAALDAPEAARVSGAPLNERLGALLERVGKLDAEIGRLSNERSAALEEDAREAVVRAEAAREVAETRRKEVLRAFVLRNAGSPLAPYVALRYLATKMDLEELEPLVEQLASGSGASPYVESLRQRIETLRLTAIGRPAPDFTLPGPDGADVSLSSFAGKIVWIDFWASWCGPCREQNPELVRLYERYRDRGFEIVGVGLEFAREPWLAAIEADALPWIQVSDVQGFGTAPAQSFAVRAIPDNVLLGRDGAILARHVEVDRLGRLLAQLVS